MLFVMAELGCGEEEKQTVQRGIPARYRNQVQAQAKASVSAGVAASSGQDVSSRVNIPLRLKRAELIESKGWDDFRRIRERIKGARDPFWPDIPELKDQDEVEVDPSSVQRRLVVKVNENHQTLKFKGTLTGATANLAMLEDGAETGYTVRVGDIIGKSPVFVRVSMITNNKIVFEPVLGIPEDTPLDSPMLSKTLREATQGGGGLGGIE
jgi:Tfp pilus assembly protein PilP